MRSVWERVCGHAAGRHITLQSRPHNAAVTSALGETGTSPSRCFRADEMAWPEFNWGNSALTIVIVAAHWRRVTWPIPPIFWVLVAQPACLPAGRHFLIRTTVR